MVETNIRIRCPHCPEGSGAYHSGACNLHSDLDDDPTQDNIRWIEPISEYSLQQARMGLMEALGQIRELRESLGIAYGTLEVIASPETLPGKQREIAAQALLKIRQNEGG